MAAEASEFDARKAEEIEQKADPSKCNGVDAMDASFVIVHGGDAEEREKRDLNLSVEGAGCGGEGGEERLENGHGLKIAAVTVENLEIAEPKGEDEKTENNGPCDENEKENGNPCGEKIDVEEYERETAAPPVENPEIAELNFKGKNGKMENNGRCNENKKENGKLCGENIDAEWHGRETAAAPVENMEIAEPSSEGENEKEKNNGPCDENVKENREPERIDVEEGHGHETAAAPMENPEAAELNSKGEHEMEKDNGLSNKNGKENEEPHGEKIDTEGHGRKTAAAPLENLEIMEPNFEGENGKDEGNELCNENKKENGVPCGEKIDVQGHGHETAATPMENPEAVEPNSEGENGKEENNGPCDENEKENREPCGEKTDIEGHDHQTAALPIENPEIEEPNSEGANGVEENSGPCLKNDKENREPCGEKIEVEVSEKEEKNRTGSEGEDDEECEEKGEITIKGKKPEGSESCSKGEGGELCLENGYGLLDDNATDAKVSEAGHEAGPVLEIEVDAKEEPEILVAEREVHLERVEPGTEVNDAVDPVTEAGLAGHEVEQEAEIVAPESEVLMESWDAEVVISESGHPEDLQLPAESLEEKCEPESVLMEANQQKEGRLHAKGKQESEIAQSQIEDPAKSDTDVLIEEKRELEAILLDQKPEPEDVEVKESRDDKLDFAVYEESEQNLLTMDSHESALEIRLDGQEEPITESLTIENDEAGIPSEANDKMEEVKSDTELRLGDGDENGSLENGTDVDGCILIDHANGSESETHVSNGPVDAIVDEFTNKDDDKEASCEETEASRGIQNSMNFAAADEEKLDVPVAKLHECRLFKVPKFSDGTLEKQLQQARMQFEEKHENRESIRAALFEQKHIANQFREKLLAAKEDEKAARDEISEKRQEIKDAQDIITKAQKASSIDDIDDQIHNMEQTIQHESMTLKQEKQYLNEIKKLRQQRDALFSNVGSQTEIQKVLEQKDKIEERLKILWKEMDSLKDKLFLAEHRTKAARKEHDKEYQDLQHLHKKHNDANELRQEAYLQRQKLNSDLRELNKYFYMFKEDQSAAKNYSFSGDKDRLRNHCSSHVEKFMELWNDNMEFRKQYIKSNEASTLRRLGTLDGRSLGPDEEPPVLCSSVHKSLREVPRSSSSADTPVPTSAPEITQENRGMLPPRKDKDVVPALKVARVKQSANSKKSAKPTPRETTTTSASNREEEEEADMVGKRISKEEEELARKQDELRKERAAAELKEQIKLEQRAKAKEAEARKKRKAEKTQARAEYKAQKEAEEKEKRRAKKGKKKAGTVKTNGHVEEDKASIRETNLPEIVQEPKTIVTTVSKRTSKPHPALKKSTKVQPLPLPPRNRTKRKMQTWMWVILITLLVLALFVAGNYTSSVKFVLPSFDI